MHEIRLDRLTLPKLSKTKEGYYRGEAYVTRAGVFEYKNNDGTSRYELRHPDDVFNKDTMDSLKGIPITDDHPPELVNIDNSDKYSLVGFTGDDPRVDSTNDHVLTSLNITHKNGTKAMAGGKRELSLGYNLDLLPEEGVYNGQHYTHRQTNIRYNHLSLVATGRAGKSARINIDGIPESHNQLIIKQRVRMEDLDKLTSRLDKLEEKEIRDNKAEMQARLDKSEAVIDQLTKENKELKAINIDSLVAEKVKERLDLLTKASKVTNVDSFKDKTDREIMESIIKVKDSNFNAANKSDAYILGRFDAIVESSNNSSSEAIKNQLSHIARRDDSEKPNTLLDILKSNNIANEKRRMA